jgi:hypothetical protein
MTSAWPEPTPAELATLTFHVTAWGSRTRVQQSICLAILRGHYHVHGIARYLRLGRAEIESALTDLIG